MVGESTEGPNKGMQGPLFKGLEAFESFSRQTTDQSFPELPAEQQDKLLKQNENEPFFGMLWAQTMLGFFAMEKHGGNRDHVSWKLINFDGHGARSYPFGYYDAEVHGGDVK